MREDGCHCGAVRYRAELDLSAAVMECNCTHCQAKGLLLAFITPDKFETPTPDEAQTEYRFNTHEIQHLFCKTCGIQSFARGEAPGGRPMVSINVRSVDGLDVDALELKPFDGRAM